MIDLFSGGGMMADSSLLAAALTGQDPLSAQILGALHDEQARDIVANPANWQNQGIWGGLARTLAGFLAPNDQGTVADIAQQRAAARPEMAQLLTAPDPYAAAANNPNINPLNLAQLLAGATPESVADARLKSAQAAFARARIPAIMSLSTPITPGSFPGNAPPSGGALPSATPPATAAGSGNGALSPGQAAQLVKGPESGGNYFVGYGGADLSGAPTREDGFPIWDGAKGPSGVSHAAGAYQFEPATWHKYATQLGIHDFSPQSQDAVFQAAYADQGLKPWAPYDASLRNTLAQLGVSGFGAPSQYGQPPAEAAQGSPVSTAASTPSGAEAEAMQAMQAGNLTPAQRQQILSLYTPQQLQAARDRGMMTAMGIPSVPPSGFLVNSRDEQYSPSLLTTPKSVLQRADQIPFPAGGAPQPAPVNPGIAQLAALGRPAAPPAAPAQPGAVPGVPAWQIAEAQRRAQLFPMLGLSTPQFLNEEAGLPFAGPKAAAEANAKNASELAYGPTIKGQEAAAQAAGKLPYTPLNVRQGGAVGFATPNGGFNLAFQNPRLPEGYTLQEGAHGTTAAPVAGAVEGVRSTAAAQSGGTAAGRADVESNPYAFTINPPANAGPGYSAPLPQKDGTILPPSQMAAPITGSAKALDEQQKDWAETTQAWSEELPNIQTAIQRTQAIMQAMKSIETGAFTTQKAEIAAALKSAGLPESAVKSIVSADPAQAEIILKNNFQAAIGTLKSAKFSRPTQMELRLTSENFANPNLQPEANLEIGSQTIGTLQWEAAKINGWAQAKRYGWRDPNDYERAWILTNPLQPMIDQEKAQIGPLKGMPGGPGTTSATAPAAEAPIPPPLPTATGPGGHKVMLKNGAWVDMQTGQPLR